MIHASLVYYICNVFQYFFYTARIRRITRTILRSLVCSLRTRAASIQLTTKMVITTPTPLTTFPPTSNSTTTSYRIIFQRPTCRDKSGPRNRPRSRVPTHAHTMALKRRTRKSPITIELTFPPHKPLIHIEAQILLYCLLPTNIHTPTSPSHNRHVVKPPDIFQDHPARPHPSMPPPTYILRKTLDQSHHTKNNFLQPKLTQQVILY